jgi:hypothetical protein
MLDPISSAMESMHSSPPTISKPDETPSPWPDPQPLLLTCNKDVNPTQQVEDAKELSLSILEHAEKWKLSSFPVELLSDTFEAFGSCILHLKRRLDEIDGVADSMTTLVKAQQDRQVRYLSGFSMRCESTNL